MSNYTGIISPFNNIILQKNGVGQGALLLGTQFSEQKLQHAEK